MTEIILISSASLSLTANAISSPVWVTPSSLGSVFDDTNLLIDLETEDSTDTFALVIPSEFDLPASLIAAGAQEITLNDTYFIFGATDADSIVSTNVFNALEDTSIRPGSTFIIGSVIANALVEDTIIASVIVDAGAASYPLTGNLTLGSSNGTIAIDVTTVADIATLVSTINAVVNNGTWEILAEDVGGLLRLSRSSRVIGNNIFVLTTTITVGATGLADGLYSLDLDSVKESINAGITNCVNVIASTGSGFLTVADSVSAIRIVDQTSDILNILAMPGFSDVSTATAATEMNALSGSSGISVVLAGLKYEFVGTAVHIHNVDSISTSIITTLGINNAGSPLLISPITEWMFISGSFGVLQGVIPVVEISTPITLIVRATAGAAFTDRTFSLRIESKDENKQITWSPGSLGTFDENSLSEMTIDISNYDVIRGSATIAIGSMAPFDLDNKIVIPGENLTIDNNADISGYIPSATTYTFDAFVSFKDVIILGPSEFSFTSDASTIGTENGFIKLMASEQLRSIWGTLQNRLAPRPILYRPDDSNFGNVDLSLIVTERIDVTNIVVPDGLFDFNVIVGDIQFAEFDNYDVIYFDLVDFKDASTFSSFTDVKFGDTIQSKNIEAIRTIATANATTETPRDLNIEDWEPRIILSYVLSGEAENAVRAYNDDIAGAVIGINQMLSMDIDTLVETSMYFPKQI